MERTKFAGVYTDDGAGTIVVRYSWEQRKFSELYARSSEKNDGSIGMDKNITVATMQFKNDVKVSTTEYLKTYYTFKLGDIAFEGHQSKEFRYGRFVENDIGNGIVSHIFAVFRPIQEYDLCFWKYAINNETLMQRILARSTKASTMMHDLVTNDFLKETFLVPSVKEQKQIGAFLNKLDHLITLHQRKLEKLKLVKKSMLEKMFPKNGSSVPEIRFNGFTDDWEQRKLSHFLDVSSEKNTDNLYTKDDVLSVSGDFGVINQIEFQGRSFAGASVSNYGVVHTGDVVYTKSPLKANPYGIIKANKGKTGIVSVLYGVYHTRENANADFIQMYFEQDTRLNNYLRPLVNKGAKNTLLISDTDALEGEVCLAPTFDEQKTIGQFFDTLDNLITLHQRKLKKLQVSENRCFRRCLFDIII